MIYAIAGLCAGVVANWWTSNWTVNLGSLQLLRQTVRETRDFAQRFSEAGFFPRYWKLLRLMIRLVIVRFQLLAANLAIIACVYFATISLYSTHELTTPGIMGLGWTETLFTIGAVAGSILPKHYLRRQVSPGVESLNSEP